MSEHERASLEARAHLVRALEADFVGPFEEGKAETLPIAPSRWYLTGFLATEQDRETESPDDQDDANNNLGDETSEEGQTHSQEDAAKQKRLFPASLGMSVLLPPGSRDESVEVTVSFARYECREEALPGDDRPRLAWARIPAPPQTKSLQLDGKLLAAGVSLPDFKEVKLVGKLEVADAPGLPKGTRALSLFVVNRQTFADKRKKDQAYLFQVEMIVDFDKGFEPRPNRQGEGHADWDDQVADLQFRNRAEIAVGHGISVVPFPESDGRVRRVRTTWLPQSEVRRVVTHEEKSVTTSMETLAQLDSAEAVRSTLSPLVEEYGKWLASQRAIELDSDERRNTRKELIEQAEAARQRIRAGIERVAEDAEVRTAFCLANRAMAESALKRSPERYQVERPKWRMFQLAFVLLNVESIANEAHKDRENVELIFFPTGGGKTEAYLGVIAFTLLLRRLRGQARDDKGLGVAVLLRYTLRLLTLDQLGRAATLVCALEALRKQEPSKLGQERFAVGLWVGRSASANTFEQLKRQTIDYKNNVSSFSPFPLVQCPWCNTELTKESLQLVPSPQKAEGIVVGCSNFNCEFSARKNREGLPVLFVDEQIYRELPCFLVATVDKFAMLPWRGETGMLFGRAQARGEGRFYGPLDKTPRSADPLPHGLRPPELIVQDELHLISGPLGTMVGLYETAIDYLSKYKNEQGKVIRPKIIASTATVRRAREQIQALFARKDLALFPPPAVDDSETWFATVDKTKPGRLYVGVAAQGRSLKGLLLRSYVALLAAGGRQYAQKQPDGSGQHPADPYMTVAGYFNSLRELGGMRRLVEDDVASRCDKIEEKCPVGHKGTHPWFKKRKIQPEPVELTSRESTAKIKQAKEQLSRAHVEKDHVDVLLASNMISVGVDIDRLGLMVVAGQPKTTAEYIQASSRVGRQHPGLVVTCFNVSKPRDRSHYERFQAYHESFYRFVEATSLTPFSGPALDRGLAGALVAMTRLFDSDMTSPTSAMNIEQVRATLGEEVIRALSERAGLHDEQDNEEHERLVKHVRDRAEKLFDAWRQIVKSARDESAGKRSFSRFDRDKAAGKSLLVLATDEDLDSMSDQERRFIAPTSMRDVEESVHLWVERGRSLGSKS
jgi:hypothetical protein